MSTFEELFAVCESLPASADDGHRVVEWVGETGRIGLARRPAGAIEVFIKGDRLLATSELVERHLKHDEWIGEPGTRFRANRIVLPPDPHFVAIAALVTEELLRHGVGLTPQTAFEAVEPIVEMALRGTTITEDALLGLFGELHLLAQLLQHSTTTTKQAKCIEAWRGYEQSSRDFVFTSGIEIEVKTTRRAESTHPISRLSQVDPYRTTAGVPIEHLYLVSLGVAPDDNQGQSVPDLMEEILESLGNAADPEGHNAIQKLFLELVAHYGSGGRGYVHEEMKGWSAYSTKWSISWNRTYSMNDEALRVLRRSDLTTLPHVDPDSVQITVRLPTDPVSLGNPAQGLQELVTRVLP